MKRELFTKWVILETASELYHAETYVAALPQSFKSELLQVSIH